MLKRRLALLALSLAVLTTASMTPVRAEEMVVDSDKIYTPGTQGTTQGFWVEFHRKRYVRNENFIAAPVGRYDATIQEAFATLRGLNRALSAAEMTKLYQDYGIPVSSSANYDSGSYHDFNWSATLDRIRDDLRTTGKYNNIKSVSADAVTLLSKLANSGSSGALVDAIGAPALNQFILEAFTANGGGAYVYTCSDNVHDLSYAHGESYVNPAEFDVATFNADKDRGIQDLLLNSTGDWKKLLGMGNVDSLAQAGRFTAMAALIDQGINPVGLGIDTWVDTVNGPVHIVESQPSAARLRDLSRWLVASTWTTHSPIALDLNHDGKIGVTGSSTAQKRLHEHGFVGQGAVWFDIMANGKQQHIEWLKGDGDAFLVDDHGGRVTRAAAADGRIDAHSLFGDAIGYTNGYHKLAYKAARIQLASLYTRDTATSWSSLIKQSPVLKGKVMDGLKVWKDKNCDAKVQPNELLTLASLGITEIGSKPTIRKNQAGEYVIQSYFVQNGKRYLTEDVWFAEDPATQGK